MIDIDDAWSDTAVTEFSQLPNLLTNIQRGTCYPLLLYIYIYTILQYPSIQYIYIYI